MYNSLNATEDILSWVTLVSEGDPVTSRQLKYSEQTQIGFNKKPEQLSDKGLENQAEGCMMDRGTQTAGLWVGWARDGVRWQFKSHCALVSREDMSTF